MDSKKILSDIVVFNKYAKYIPELKRRETWEEICDRTMLMHIKKFPFLKDEIEEVFNKFVKTKKVLPSLRSMQFAGAPIEKMPTRIFNCSALSVDHPASFSEAMFLLLGGSGVGFSVQFHHVEQLPTIKKPGRTRRFLISDDITGWADAVKALCKAYFYGKSMPDFDYSDIRPKGAVLKTSGGRAPGAEPLKTCIHNLQRVFDRKQEGEQLKPIECYDLMCFIADAVLAGGIRRAATICLFSFDDEEMLTSKSGNWWETNPQRGRANNSAIILRHRVKKEDFFALWNKIKASGCGEPGFIFSNNSEYLFNPCVEASLRSNSFCNLCEGVLTDVYNQEELNSRAKAAAFIGTLQASYTDFHYLRDVWKKTTEKDSLLGVSWTGISSNTYLGLDLKEASKVVVEENRRVSKVIGIRPAARTTCTKPSGTASLVVGSSSGIHAWYSEYYIRRMKIGKSEPLYKYLLKTIPRLIEDDVFSPKKDAFVFVPIAAPKGSITSDNESAIELLSRVKHFSDNWIKPGHVSGDNTHNVSATVYVENDQWDEIGNWMWDNRDSYNGLSVLPKSNHTYVQTPFESITKEKYEELVGYCNAIDLKEVIEEENNTDLKGEAACAGGVCELTY